MTALPLALAALDVAGTIRERSPADMAIFGEASGRLAERFMKPETGQDLLARAVSDGTAEAVAWLVTAAGQRCFQVGLWRQRGGDRIRVLAAFAACGQPDNGAGQGAPGLSRETAMRLGRDMKAPLAALAGFAEKLRAGGRPDPAETAAHASDIVAAAWRLRRLADDLLAAAASQDGLSPMHFGEVDIARLVRRITRLAGPAAQGAGVTISLKDLPPPGEGPAILGDEGGLWGAIEALLGNAIRHGGRGSEVSVSLIGKNDGQVLQIADTGPGADPERLAAQLEGTGSLAACRAMLRLNGADLEILTSPGRGLTARIGFPAARCLNLV